MLFERVSPSVVSIQAMKINKERPQRRFETIVGSGFFIDKDGHVLTNAHVVDGAASLSVTLDNGDKLPARTVGLDPVLDLALIRVEGRNGLPSRASATRRPCASAKRSWPSATRSASTRR